MRTNFAVIFVRFQKNDSVSKAETGDIFEFMKATIKKGPNRNPFRMAAMKAEILCSKIKQIIHRSSVSI